MSDRRPIRPVRRSSRAGRALFWVGHLAVAYTLVGYPLAVAVLARLVGRPWRRRAWAPTVSLVVAAYNEAQCIQQKLENCLALDYPRDRLQVLVAADGSDDATPELARAAGRVFTVLHQPERSGKAAAVNRAVERAGGEILVLSDANAMYAPDALRELVAGFADPAVAVVTGAKQLVGGHVAFGRAESLYWVYENWIRSNESLLGQATGVNGELLAVRRADWRPLPAAVVNDDFHLALEAIARGRRVVFEPRARAFETSTASAADELARRRRIVAGRWQALDALARLLDPPRPLALWQVLSHKLARALLPFLGLAALIGSAGLARTARPRGALGRLEALVPKVELAVVLLGLARLLGARPPGPLGAPAAAAAYLLHAQYGALLGLATRLTGRQSVAWARAARATSPAG